MIPTCQKREKMILTDVGIKDRPSFPIRMAALLIVLLVLLVSAAQAEKWLPSEKNSLRFRKLVGLLEDSVLQGAADTAAIDKVLGEIRRASEDEYDIARAVADHWYAVMLDPEYKMYQYRDELTAHELEWSGLDFGGKHAFVVLGYQLDEGHMRPELIGRCDAAAAAARAFPDSYIVTTGGVTGGNNPDGKSEGGLMKTYLSGRCGIDADRIFAEKEALTTLENAVYSLRILQENGIEKITVVTSDYHQRCGQVMFNALAAIYAKATGYQVQIVGNYNYRARPDSAGPGSYLQMTAAQLGLIFRKGVTIYKPEEKTE